jgi:2'-5' RNA ligase
LDAIDVPGHPDSAEKLRLFVSLHPPESWREPLRRVQALGQRQFPPDTVRWTPVEQIHLTLRFLGDVPAADALRLTQALRAACGDVAPFTLAAGKCGQFPARGAPRVLWLGLRAADDTLARLQARVAEAAADWAEAEADDRFHPHLTLGRCRPARSRAALDLAALAGEARALRFEDWRVEEVQLMRSRLQPGGAVHEIVEQLPLRCS